MGLHNWHVCTWLYELWRENNLKYDNDPYNRKSEKLFEEMEEEHKRAFSRLKDLL